MRPLVVRGCNRCWDVVPWVCSGEHLTIRTLAVSSALLVLSERARGRLWMLFVGDDWAEDHVRHEASEFERR